MKKLIVVLALAAVSCSRGASGEVSGLASPSDSRPSSVAVNRARAVAADTSAPAMPRMIVRSAEMRVVVVDTAKAVREATKAAEAVGGYVTGSHVWREGELLRARLTLRVPADKLTPALAQMRALAKRVEDETLKSEDVSEEFVDLEARVRNLEATEEELRQLLVVARQNARKASEVLEVHQELTRIRGEIEQLKGRMRYLSQVTAMSSIALEMTPDALAQPVVEPGWQPLVVAKDAMRALVGALQTFANVAIWLLIYALPVAGILALIAVPVWRLARRVRAREA